MELFIHSGPEALGEKAGKEAASIIRTALASHNEAFIILATGTSQFATLKTLVAAEGIAWNKVTIFHLDEYIGVPDSHRASFRKYIKERFIEKVPALKKAWLINGETVISDEIKRLNNAIKDVQIDLALVGIGENGHLAFNDPPANFETDDPYIVVDLDAACRKQQMGEGWFRTIHEVPLKAISMSVKQILKSKHIICSVPDQRKAQAVLNTMTKPVSNLFPASILRNHLNCNLHLDPYSSSLLPPTILKKAN